MRVRGVLVHCCLLDRDCWRGAWRYGMPLRLHIGRRFWTIYDNDRRSRRIWDSPTATVYRRDPETNTWYRRDNYSGDWIEDDAPPRWRRNTRV